MWGNTNYHVDEGDISLRSIAMSLIVKVVVKVVLALP